MNTTLISGGSFDFIVIACLCIGGYAGWYARRVVERYFGKKRD